MVKIERKNKKEQAKYQLFVIFIMLVPIFLTGWYLDETTDNYNVIYDGGNVNPLQIAYVDNYNSGGIPMGATYPLLIPVDNVSSWTLTPELIFNQADKIRVGAFYDLDENINTFILNFSYEFGLITDDIITVSVHGDSGGQLITTIINNNYLVGTVDNENIVIGTDYIEITYTMSQVEYENLKYYGDYVDIIIDIVVDATLVNPTIWDTVTLETNVLYQDIARPVILPYMVLGFGFMYMTIGLFMTPWINLNDIMRKLKKK